MSCDQCINSSGWIFWTFTVGFWVLLLPEAHFIIGFWSRMFCIIISTYFERSWKIRIYQKIGLYACFTCLQIFNNCICEYYNSYNNTFANSAVCWASDFCFWIRTVWFKSGAPFFIFAYSSNINKISDNINWQIEFLCGDQIKWIKFSFLNIYYLFSCILILLHFFSLGFAAFPQFNIPITTRLFFFVCSFTVEEAGGSFVYPLVLVCSMLVVIFIFVAEDAESPFVDGLVTVCRIVVVVFKSVDECADLCKF